MMKFLVQLLCATLTSLLLAMPANAEKPQYNVSDLREQVKGGWRQTYEAYGRTIQIDLDIQVPDVEKAPVLLVQRHPIIPEPRFSELAKRFAAPKGDTKNSYWFDSRENDKVTVFSYKYPFKLDESKGETMLNTSWPNRSLITFDWNQAYADNNPLTVREAFDIVVKRYQEVFGDDYQLELQANGLEDRFVNKKTGEPIREKGGYQFRLRQVLRGIPLFSTAHRAYWPHLFLFEGENYDDFFVKASIVDENSFDIYCQLLQEKAVVHEDIPFVSFDLAKAAIEELIQKGQIRQIYSLRLAYVLYNDPSDLGNTFYLVPSWVAWCEEYRAPQDEANEFDAREMYFGTSGYNPVIVNAQTGQVLDFMNQKEDRCHRPPIVLWEDVQ